MLTNKPNTDNNGLDTRANGLGQNELGPFAKVMVLLRAFAFKTLLPKLAKISVLQPLPRRLLVM